MKARTAREKEVVALSATLPLLTPDQVDEARRAYAELFVGKTTGAWCSSCGGEVPSGDLWNNKRKKFVTCPHCGAKMRIKRSSRKAVSHDKYYYTVVTVVKDWQVIRNYICERNTKRRMMIAGVEACPADTYFTIYEVAQSWLDGKDAPVFMALSCSPHPYYCDIWNIGSNFSLKRQSSKYYIHGHVASRPQLLPIVKRNGVRKLDKDINPFEQINAVLLWPEAETLAKAGQKELFKSICHGRTEIHQYWASVKVALRNGYRIKDVSLWLDYIRLLELDHKDIHNAVYVCPADLGKAHDHYFEIERRKQEQRDREREAEKMRAFMEKMDDSSPENVAYHAKVSGRLLAVVVKVGDIQLAPLQDIRDFYEEGETLHHCVCAMKYYEHPHTLIVGARVKGERTETIEIDTENWRIVQCRGKYNQDSPYHRQIYELATSSLQRFRACL